MKKYFKVSFESNGIFCSNIAHADSAEEAKVYYSEYEYVSVKECDSDEVEEALHRGKPIIELQAVTQHTSVIFLCAFQYL